jgi:hypothetical protein
MLNSQQWFQHAPRQLILNRAKIPSRLTSNKRFPCCIELDREREKKRKSLYPIAWCPVASSLRVFVRWEPPFFIISSHSTFNRSGSKFWHLPDSARLSAPAISRAFRILFPWNVRMDTAAAWTLVTRDESQGVHPGRCHRCIGHWSSMQLFYMSYIALIAIAPTTMWIQCIICILCTWSACASMHAVAPISHFSDLQYTVVHVYTYKI